MNFGAFAGGMAGGLSQGMQLKNMKKRTDMASEKFDMDKEEHGWKKAEREKMQKYYERVGNEVMPMSFRADGGSNDMTVAPSMPDSFALKPAAERPSFGAAPGGLGGGIMGAGQGLMGAAKGVISKFAAGGLVDLDEEFAQSAGPSATQMPPPQAALQQPAQPAQQQPVDPKENMMRGMWDGDVLSDPEKLTAMARIAHEEGVGTHVIPWLEKAYAAKKSGKMNGAMKLLQGDVDGAITDLARGGMKLADRPQKLNDDPNDFRWKINIEGSGEQVMDLHHLVATTMDPDKYLETHYKRKDADREFGLKENEDKRKDSKNTADIGLVNSQTEYYKGAKTNESLARAGRYGRMGTGERAERPENVDRALARHDKTLDALASVKGADDKFEIDPQKRMKLANVSTKYQDYLEKHLDRYLNAREINILTDSLQSYPQEPELQKQWGRQLLQRLGAQLPAEKTQGATQGAQQEAPPPGSLAATAQPAAAAPPPATPPAPPRAGGLAALQEQQALRDKMNAIQTALQNPNLTPEQKQQLAVQAQQVATVTDAYYKGR